MTVLLLYVSFFLLIVFLLYGFSQLFLPKWYFTRRLRRIGKTPKVKNRVHAKQKKRNKVSSKYHTLIENGLVDAKIPLTVNEFLLTLLLINAFTAIVTLLLTNVLITSFVVVGIFYVPLFFFSRLRKRKKEKMIQQLPDALEVISTSLKSGFSLVQTFEVLAEEGLDPLSEEFKMLRKELVFGKSLDDALEDFAIRNDLFEIQTFVDTVLIAKETGGSMTNVFDELTKLMRESEQLRKETKALTAQGRVSAFIIGSMPFGLFIFVFMINPEYMQVLYTTKIGIILLVFSLVLQIIGIFVMKKMIELKAR